MRKQTPSDAELVKKIKPKLRKFVTTQLREKAEETAKEKAEETKELLAMDEVIKRASELSAICFFKRKLWEQYPPYFAMNWTKTGAPTQAEQMEMHGDVAGFATYLARAYNYYLKNRVLFLKTPSPMDEDNLMYYWKKFNLDCALLTQADARRIQAGNRGVILPNEIKQ